MAVLTVAALYNSKNALSLLSAMILKVKYRSDTLTLVDVVGMAEAAMTTAINTITNATQDRVYCTCPTSASYSAVGIPSVDVNLNTNFVAKIKVGAVSPYNAVINLSAFSTYAAPARFWRNLYAEASTPKVVQLLDGATFPAKVEATATSAAAGTLTHTGQFTASAFIGYYVGITSATTGAGQVRKIASNTTGVLTLSRNWGITPTGIIKYAIYQYEGDALKEVTIPLAIYAEMWDFADISVIGKYYKLLDLGLFDTKVAQFVPANGLLAPHQDRTIVDELHKIGLHILKYNSR